MGFPGGSADEESACNAGDLGSKLGRYPGGGKGYPLQYSCLKNSMDRGAWRATAQGVTKKESDPTEWLSTAAASSNIMEMTEGKFSELGRPKETIPFEHRKD